jgi:hypothetical protein
LTRKISSMIYNLKSIQWQTKLFQQQTLNRIISVS